MKKALLSALLCGAIGLSGCQTLEATKSDIGGVLGAITGGVLASNVGGGKGQLVAVGVGTLVGALVGSEIGKSLDRADVAYADRANQQAHTTPVGQTINWNNPETGNRGSVTPLRDGYGRNSGSFCREYEQVIYVEGRQETGVGVACKQPDGRWEIMN
jgi:surface antigen